MKKGFFAVLGIALFLFLMWGSSILFPTPTALAVTNGTSVANESFTLYNAATGTTGAYTPTAKTLDYVYNNIICDVIVTPSTAGTTTVALYSNAGSTATDFDTAVSLIAPTAITSGQSIRTFTSSGEPFRTIRATITSPTTTAVTKINCGAVQ